VLEPGASTLRCHACRAALSPASLADCPRCGADNRAWATWTRAGLPAHLERFFPGSAWGRLALLSLLAPPAAWLGWGGLALAGACLLAPAGPAALFCLRHPLWTCEQARRVSPGRRPGLLALGGAGFLLFGGAAALLLAAGGPHSPGAALALALALTANTWAAGLYAVHAYGLWLARAFPAPIFLDEARLRELALRAIRPRLQVKAGGVYEAVAVVVVEAARTGTAGLSLRLRAEAGSDEVWQGRTLAAVQGWRAACDRWGRVLVLEREGPWEYVPGGSAPVGALVDTAGDAWIEGEVLVQAGRQPLGEGAGS
jgi:hypothetical protein